VFYVVIQALFSKRRAGAREGIDRQPPLGSQAPSQAD
jgi:hypothetical protein